MPVNRVASRTHVVRIIPSLDDRLRRRAKKEQRTITEVWRDALALYLANGNKK